MEEEFGGFGKIAAFAENGYFVPNRFPWDPDRFGNLFLGVAGKETAMARDGAKGGPFGETMASGALTEASP